MIKAHLSGQAMEVVTQNGRQPSCSPMDWLNRRPQSAQNRSIRISVFCSRYVKTSRSVGTGLLGRSPHDWPSIDRRDAHQHCSELIGASDSVRMAQRYPKASIVAIGSGGGLTLGHNTYRSPIRTAAGRSVFAMPHHSRYVHRWQE